MRTLGQPRSDGSLACAALAFVGTTSPFRGWRYLVDGTSRLAPVTSADLLVVNTGGLVAGPGNRLKAQKIAALSPDLIVTIGDDNAIARMLSRYAQAPTLRLAASELAKRKTEAQRRAARRAAFRAYFADATEAAARISDLRIEDKPAADTILPVRLLVGLADAERDLGLGILAAVNPDAGTLTCLTPITFQSATRLRCGALMLDGDLSERPLPRPTADDGASS
jgi:polynucleotide 5'-hydroxyl-kinase GRC3/NOL9